MTNETMMKGILHALNSIAGSLNPNYQPLDERIYDNEQRLFIINKARTYINERRKDYNYDAIDSSISFDVDYKMKRVACVIFSRKHNEITHRGVYHLKSDYEATNEYIAAALALANALGEPLPWANNIPQPHAPVNGHEIKYQGSSKTVMSKDSIVTIEDEYMYEFVCCSPNSEHAREGKITNDTDALYGHIKKGESDI